MQRLFGDKGTTKNAHTQVNEQLFVKKDRFYLSNNTKPTLAVFKS